MIGSVVKLFIH